MKLFYFTATGNSLFVAKKISESLRKVELLSIPKVLKDNKKEYITEVIAEKVTFLSSKKQEEAE